MNVRSIILFGLLLVSVSPLLAQMHQPLRMEVELKRQDDDYLVMSMKEKGIVLFRELAKITCNN